MRAADVKPPAIFVTGPTASGKTAVAMQLREHLPLDIVSVDATQVYRGLDIGSGKPTRAELQAHPHRLLDIRDPAQPYSAAEFRRDALAEMARITAGGRIPLLVGGTMLYFHALHRGLSNLPRADAALRADLLARAQAHGWDALHEQLARLDPVAAARIAPGDRQRLQRALEVCLITGRPMSAQLGSGRAIDEYRVLPLVLAPARRSVLHERIARRFHGMLARGLVEEVESLLERGDLPETLPAMRAVGYRQVREYLLIGSDYSQMVKRGIAATRQLAKRQLTWLRSESGSVWIDSGDSRCADATRQVLGRWLEGWRGGQGA